MIVGIGVDVVDLARFEQSIRRTPGLLPRLFSDSERTPRGRTLGVASLAGRFAAKEALIKAIGDPAGLRWHDMQVVSDELGNPSFELTGSVAEVIEARGVATVHLSMTHDGGVATAFVIAEGRD